MSAKSEKAGVLYDYAVERPDGFTYQDVKDDLGWERVELIAVARRLRLILGDDEINLVCDPQGQQEPWLYRLVGNYDDARPWATNRIGDIEARLGTIAAVATTLVSATDGRSMEGRRARKVANTLGYLLGELADIDGRLNV